MNLKSFINNKYTLVGSIVFYLTGVYLTSRFATYLPCEGSPGILFPSAERWLSSPLSNHSVNSILILSGGILLLRINNLFSLIQKHTLLPFLFFLLLEVCSPSLSLLCNGNIMAVVLTTIQKLDVFIQKNLTHPIRDKHIVLVFDECHRSQFGDMDGF